MNECLSWASLSDKSAVVEALSAEERLFLRTHPSVCAACASEMTWWENLGQVLNEPERLTACRLPRYAKNGLSMRVRRRYRCG
jgi:hypothetical protein